ncbi:hypothetical protein I5421_05980 [Citrobacter braakii]|nr:hypothetical protein [Citrobacter braakii]MBJ8901141.1 hypothetical protein [Citrobacter braakii]MBJ8905796.1 hypothetical protein [Citrobacter braakii]MBJ8919348.1 hypothetical protein [Citrobacter braakii]
MNDNNNPDVSKMAQAIEELTKQVSQLCERMEVIEKGIRQENEGLLAWVE